MKNIPGIILLIAALTWQSPAQVDVSASPFRHRHQPLPIAAQADGGLLTASALPVDPEDNKKDPAYATYKEGYDAILDERWEDAIKKFSDVVSKYAKSAYLDDAEYWKAYALSHISRTKAIQAYELFMEKHPKSRYIDDVVADLGRLNPMVIVTAKSGDSTQIRVSSSPHGYAYTLAPDARTADEEMKKSDAMMRRLERQLSRHFAPRPPQLPGSVRLPSLALWETEGREKLDPDTRVRLEALYAIGDTKEDETAFQTLRDVALDRNQNVRLRQAAIEVLSEFKKFDVMPVFLDLARKDTNAAIQEAAIEFIGTADKDRNKSVETLISLFHAMPAQRKGSVLYAIADVGNDKAVDFLASVARSHEDDDLRSDAVYYLGTIGGEKARNALYEILRSK